MKEVSIAANCKQLQGMVCDLANQMELICQALPLGDLKTNICGEAALLNLICLSFPQG